MSRSEEMERLLKGWKSSGLSLLAFSKREELSYSKLQYWAAKLGATTKRDAKPQSVELAPVHVVPDAASEPPKPQVLSVWLTNGVSLEVPTGFDELELRRLVGILSTC